MYFTVYGRSNCHYCSKAKQLLQAKGMEFNYKDVTEDEEFFLHMDMAVKEATGSSPKTVPQIFSDTGYVGGYTDLVFFLNQVKEVVQPGDFDIGEL